MQKLAVQHSEIIISVASGSLAATVMRPMPARGTVLFAYGSGSSRHSPRNKGLAGLLNDRGYATILLDLLTIDEDHRSQLIAHSRFDVAVAAQRLIEVIDWLPAQDVIGELPLGLFGASTGAAAALIAAGRRPQRVGAVVSRGGRPDLARTELPGVRAPTLLVVGAHDHTVIELSREAATTIGDHAQVMVIPGANHLFSEPGALHQVAEHTVRWFDRHLCPPALTQTPKGVPAPRCSP